MKRARTIRVSVPATTSNLGPGYDVLGMALGLRNELEVQTFDEQGPLTVEIRGEGAGSLPETAGNMAVQAFRSVLPKTRFAKAMRFKMTNRIPLCRGLGSSGAARLSGLLAAAALADPGGRRLDGVVEKAAALEGHPDNVVPAFLGGLCASYRLEGELRFFRLRTPAGLRAVVCVPELEVSTKKARRLMPKKVPLSVAVYTASRLALLVSAFEQKRYDRLSAAMDDRLHQPARGKLVPGMNEAIAAAHRAGAFGAALSGSGPAVFALSGADPAAREVGRAMERAFERKGIGSRSLDLPIDTRGAQVKMA